MGVNTADWGLTLSPIDMAKIGQLYLNHGIWNSKQIVSANGGNTIYINTKKDMVVSIASLFRPKVKDRIEFILEYIEPIFDN